MHVQQDLFDAVDAGDRVTVTVIFQLLNNGSDELTFDTHFNGVGIEPEETDFEDIDVDEHATEIERIAGELGRPRRRAGRELLSERRSRAATRLRRA